MQNMIKQTASRAFVLALAIGAGCATRPFHMPSASMQPTIRKDSTVSVDFGAYVSAAPERFDIVAFHPPGRDAVIYLFRVVGIPGENVEITDQGLYVNGKAVSPPNDIAYRPAPSGINKVVLKSTTYFLLGDHILIARDSRYIGPVDRARIVGKVTNLE